MSFEQLLGGYFQESLGPDGRPLVRVEDGAVIVNGGCDYSIGLDTIRSHAELLGWTVQLSEKSWATPEMLRLFIVEAAAAAGLDIRRP